MKSKNDFGQFRRKIFLRTIAVLAAAAAVIYLTCAVLLRGRFANGMVSLFQNTLGMDYDAALRFYERTFRSRMDCQRQFEIVRSCTNSLSTHLYGQNCCWLR